MHPIFGYCFLTIFISLCIVSPSAAQTEHQALIWRGFEHKWTYNHRINRLGNFVQFEQGKPMSYHSSASGIGRDSTFFTSHYSFIESPCVFFKEGKVEIKLFGKEKQLLTKTVEVTIPAKDYLQNRNKYVTLINGFDLRAVDRADKIQLLRLNISNARYAPALQELRFEVQVALVVNCQSFECARFNQRATYKLQLNYLIIAADGDDFYASTLGFSRSYPWDKRNEYEGLPKERLMYGFPGGVYPEVALGVKSLALTLDKEHWTLEYHANVEPLSYDAESGIARFDLDLFFKEWQHGMKQHSATPKQSKFSSKRKGWCIVDMDVLLMQFREAKVVHKKHSGQMYWEGMNTPSSGNKALSSTPLQFFD